MSDVINDCSVLLSYYCIIYVLLLIFLYFVYKCNDGSSLKAEPKPETKPVA